MNKQIAKTVLALAVTAMTTTQAQAMPAIEQLMDKCWDHTFAYTNVSVKKTPAELKLKIKSQNAGIFGDLAPGQSLPWADSTLTLTVPLKNSQNGDNCFFHPTDSRVLYCQATPTIHGLVGIIDGKLVVNETVPTPHVAAEVDLKGFEGYIVINKITEIGASSTLSSYSRLKVGIHLSKPNDIRKLDTEINLTLDENDQCYPVF